MCNSPRRSPATGKYWCSLWSALTRNSGLVERIVCGTLRCSFGAERRFWLALRWCHRLPDGVGEHVSFCLLASYYRSLSVIDINDYNKQMPACVCNIRTVWCLCMCQTAGETVVCVSLIIARWIGGKKPYGRSVLFFPPHPFFFFASCPLWFLSASFHHSPDLVSEGSRVSLMRERLSRRKSKWGKRP